MLKLWLRWVLANAPGELVGLGTGLRVAARRARGGGWLLANALAWMLGMPIVVLGASTTGSGASGLGQFAPIWLATAAAGAVVGAVHGWALVWLVRGDAA